MRTAEEWRELWDTEKLYFVPVVDLLRMAQIDALKHAADRCKSTAILVEGMRKNAWLEQRDILNLMASEFTAEAKRLSHE